MFTLTFHPRNHAVKSIILKNREHLRDIERNDKDASRQIGTLNPRDNNERLSFN